jgi:tetratricopeptide (TPR) repeat protein
VPSAAEHLWYLASMAGMEEINEPAALAWGLRSSSLLAPLSRALGVGGQLAITSRRFPEEPRFKLARVVSLEWQLRDWWHLTPSYLELAQANAALHVPDDPRSDDDITLDAVQRGAANTMRLHALVPEMIRQYQALGIHPDLRAEIALHIGGLESRSMHWSTALGHLRRVPTLTTEPFLLYLAEFLTGRTMHNMGDHGAASAAFERATVLVPNARAAGTWLAAELLMSENAGDRDRAYPLLKRVYSDAAPDDPWRLYFQGDGRRWPIYMKQLREALQ